MTPLPSLLLLGPTGSGKTPLGQVLQERGLSGRRCLHFDFGDNLRQAVERDRPDEILSLDDLQFLRGVLQTGALLEDDDFPIAERVLRSFLDRERADQETLLVLNGLPRHVGQAEALREMLDVGTVVTLVCTPEVVFHRIATNAGGDRTERSDDEQADIRRKLSIYARRTAPLVDHYQQRGARLVELQVSTETTADQLWAEPGLQAGI
jgi:adenylate kinase family enzyme